MSSIVLLVGQCGNQVGHDLMTLIDTSDIHPLCHRDGKLRCVCVDSESKVIGRNYCDDTRRSALYRERNMISGQKGRGNNWALGYHGFHMETAETSLLHRTMESLRMEVERCDNYAGNLRLAAVTACSPKPLAWVLFTHKPVENSSLSLKYKTHGKCSLFCECKPIESAVYCLNINPWKVWFIAKT